MPDAVFDVLGMVGVVFYIGTYGALQFGIIRGTSLTYSIGNLLAASLVLASLLHDYNAASAIVNGIWIAISLVGLVRVGIMLHRQRFTPEEEAIRLGLLDNMSKPMARMFFDLGEWIDLESGFQLTQQGAAVDTLYCVLSGRAVARSGGHDVGVVTGGFIGEMNVLEARSASASVVITEPTRVFAVRGTALARKVSRDAEFRSAMEGALSRDTARKLQAANQRAREALFH